MAHSTENWYIIQRTELVKIRNFYFRLFWYGEYLIEEKKYDLRNVESYAIDYICSYNK
jgi:hypothetical protein